MFWGVRAVLSDIMPTACRAASAIAAGISHELMEPSSTHLPCLLSKYEVDFGSLVGSGTFSKVWQCWPKECSQNEPVSLVVKVLSLCDTLPPGVHHPLHSLGEVHLQSRMQHTHIVAHVDYIEDLYFVGHILEACRGGTLFDAVNHQISVHDRGLEFLDSTTFAMHIVSAMLYLKQCNVVHRDIKLENIFLKFSAEFPIAWNTYVLGDFGSATLASTLEKNPSRVGSWAYMAPEVLCGVRYGHEVDVWSLGVAWCTSLIADLPFEQPYLATIQSKWGNGSLALDNDLWQSLPTAGKLVIAECLTIEPTHRVSVEGLPAKIDMLSQRQCSGH